MNLKEPSTHATRPRAAAGFTLIELMITVAIIGILAAIAYPSYADYVRRGKRATAQAALMDVASRQQTYLLDRRVYTGTVTDLGFAVPAEIAADYAFALVASAANVTPPTFSATATPSAALQSKGELTLTVNQAGARTPVATRGYWGY